MINYSIFSNKTISANNTPSVSPCSSPTIVKKDVFAKITALTSGKNSPDGPVSAQVAVAAAAAAAPPTPHHIHRHHRNTSTVSQSDTVLTTQPSTQSIVINTLSDQSYSSLVTDPTLETPNAMNNGTTTHQPSRRNPPQQLTQQILPSATSISSTSDSMNMESSPSINAPATPNNNQWRHKLNNLKQSFQSVGTPRFHRRPKVLCNSRLSRRFRFESLCFVSSNGKW